MGNQSITVWLLLCLKTAFQNSFTFSVLLKFVSFLKNILIKLKCVFEDSLIYSLTVRFASFLQRELKSGYIYSYVMSDKGLHNAYKDSVFYKVIDVGFGWILQILSYICKIFAKLAKNGIIHKSAKKLCSFKYVNFDCLFAAYTVLMMILPHELWNNIYAVAVAFAFCAVYVLKAASERTEKPNVYSMPLSLIVFVISVIGAVLISPAFFDSLRIALFFVSSVLFAVIIRTNIRNENSLKFFVSSLITGLFVMSLYAVYQKIVGVEVDPLLTDVNTNAGMPGRVFSTVGNPNNFAEIIVMIVPFIYGMIICGDSSKKKCLYAIALVLSLGALAMSYSRSGYVAFAIATVVFAVMYNWKLLIPIAAIGIISIPFIPETIMNRIFTIGSLQDTSNAYRIFLWEGASELLKDYFLSGIGIGSEAFLEVYPDYAHFFAAKAPHSHMLYMELLIELGVIGISSFLIYMFSTLRKGFAVLNKSDKFMKCITAASISAFCGISFTACVEYIWFYPRVMFVFWMVAGILMCSVRLSENKTDKK